MKHTNSSIAQIALDNHPAELHTYPSRAGRACFEFGWSAYEDGLSVLDLDTDEQRCGWLAAAELEELVDDMHDREDWSRGGW